MGKRRPGVGTAILKSWGTRARLSAVQYAWIMAMFGLLAALETNRLGLFLVPPFGASLTILLVLPEAQIAQPYALIVGSVTGASVGTVLSFLARGSWMAIVAAIAAFGILNLIRAYHPPGVALAMYPALLHASRWFPLDAVLPFTVTAVASAAVLSHIVKDWPAYPRALRAS
jgi:CBS-domain-containing membrane protein